MFIIIELKRARVFNFCAPQVEQGYMPFARDENYGATALHAAAQNGRTDIMTFLLEQGMDPGARDVTEGDTVLHWAAYAGAEAACRLLLERGCATPYHSIPQPPHHSCVPTRQATPKCLQGGRE